MVFFGISSTLIDAQTLPGQTEETGLRVGCGGMGGLGGCEEWVGGGMGGWVGGGMSGWVDGWV